MNKNQTGSLEHNIWDDQDALLFFEKERDKHREDIGRLTFDCFHAKFIGDRVKCDQGFALSRAMDGSLHLLSVLKGRTSTQCKSCSKFDGD